MSHLGTFFLPKGKGPINFSATRIPGGIFVGITMNETVYRFIVESEDEASLEALRKKIGNEILDVVKKLATEEVDRMLGKGKTKR
jgi:hypothetical protein